MLDVDPNGSRPYLRLGRRRTARRTTGALAFCTTTTVLALTLTGLLLSLLLPVPAHGDRACYVGQVSRGMDDGAAQQNTLARTGCDEEATLCARCCSYSYNATNFQSGEKVRRCVAFISTDDDSCKLETPASLAGRHKLFTCDSDDLCLACGEFTGSKVSGGGGQLDPKLLLCAVIAVSLSAELSPHWW